MKNYQNYQNLLKITNPSASIGNEHGTKIQNERVQLLEKILENWHLGREVEIITYEEEDILESKEDKVFTVLKKSEVLYFENDSIIKDKK